MNRPIIKVNPTFEVGDIITNKLSREIYEILSIEYPHQANTRIYIVLSKSYSEVIRLNIFEEHTHIFVKLEPEVEELFEL